MLPTFQKTNSLITQVASVLNLELNADGEADPDSNYTFEDMKSIAVTFENQQNFNLSTDTDGKSHFAILAGYNLYLNSKAEDYDDINELLTEDNSQITGVISSVIQSHTATDGTQDVIEKEALEKIQELLDSKAAVKLTLNGYVRQ